MTTTGKKRVVVVGATGTIGKALCKRLIESGYELVVFSSCFWAKLRLLLPCQDVLFRRRLWSWGTRSNT